MLRVYATIKHSQYKDSMASELNDLKSWIIEIQNGMYALQVFPSPLRCDTILMLCSQDKPTSLFHNYANNETWFFDASSTALLASTVYRIAQLEGIYTYIPQAEAARKALSAFTHPNTGYTSWGTGDGSGPAIFLTTAAAKSWPTETASYAVPTPASGGKGLDHFTPAMWLTPVVDPDSFRSQGGSSPEGQAFVVEMYAAYKDWAALGSPGLLQLRRRALERRASSAMGRIAGASAAALAVAGTWAVLL